MTALTALEISQLNKMNRASQNISLGTKLDGYDTNFTTLNNDAMTRGVHTVVTADLTAGSIAIADTGLDYITAHVSNVTRSGSAQFGYTVSIGGSTGASASNLYLGSGSPSDYSIAVDDVWSWIAWM